MRKTFLIMSLLLCAAVPSQAQSVQDKELVDNFLHAGRPPCFDCPAPYSEELAARPDLAPLLAEALRSEDAAVKERKTSVIFMLGRMGNPAVFQSLAKQYDPALPDNERTRLMISLGACLSEETRDQYLELALNDPELLMWLEETVGKLCEYDLMCWKVFFQREELAKFREQCRKLSQPILG